MSRPRTYSDDAMLDAARAVVRERGRSVSVSAIAAALGTPPGTVRHRYPDGAEQILGALWLRAVRRFHAELLPLLRTPEPEDAVRRSVRCVVRYCREHPDEASALTLFRQRELATTGPRSLRAEASHVNDALGDAMEDLSVRMFGTASRANLDLLRVACQQIPYDLARPHIGTHIPAWVEVAAEAAASAVLVRAPH